jgi:hypothetical protein
MSAQEFDTGKCDGSSHGFGTGIAGIKDLVHYEVSCSNPNCGEILKPTTDFKTARFRAESHAWKRKDHPALVKTVETYRDGHKHEFFASPDMAIESKGATGYKASKAEQRKARSSQPGRW